MRPHILAEFVEELTGWLPGKGFTLLYRGSRDGMTAADFHRLCDGKGATVTLIRSTNGFTFGGYTSKSWASHAGGSYVADASAFLFTVVNPYSHRPTRYPTSDVFHAVYHFQNIGPRFGRGADLLLFGLPTSDLCVVHGTSHNIFPTSYIDALGRGKTTFTWQCGFTPEEVEVWLVA